MSSSDEHLDVLAAQHSLELLHQLEREIVTAELAGRIDALERVAEAVRHIGDLGSPEGILDRAAQGLGASSRFDRVLISQVQSGVMLPQALWQLESTTNTHETLRALSRSPLRLDYPLIEEEVAQRQSSEVVIVPESGPRTPQMLSEALAWNSYVVVALTLEGQTIGLLHADATARARTVDALDQEVACLFADGLAGAFERVALRQTLRHHREELRHAVQWMSERFRTSDPDRAPGAATLPDANLEALTPREVDVLRLLARGDTNLSIANSLLISEGTVKYHVKNVLRKLQATSRADAVARYLRSGR